VSKLVAIRLTPEQARTVLGIVSEQRGRREHVHSAQPALKCQCRTAGKCTLCRPVEELREIEQAVDNALWEQNDRAWIRALHQKYGMKCQGTDCRCQS